MTFIGRYRDRPDTLKLQHTLTTHKPETQEIIEGSVYHLNDYNVTVWADGTVTAQRRYHVSSSPEKHFPNMTVSDGVLNIPIEDLTEFLLMRVTPLELAEGILADDEARERLIECLASRHSSPSFTDEDRRKWLTQVQSAVHSKALDHAVQKLNKIEEDNRAKSDHYRWHSVQLGAYNGLYKSFQDLIGQLSRDEHGAALAVNWEKYLRECHLTPEALKEYVEQGRDPISKESTGAQWHESRDFWRKWLQEQFPAPEKQEEDTEPTDII